jgi:hypothetical protein
LVEKLKETEHLKKLRADGRIILKQTKSMALQCETDSPLFGQRREIGSCEHGDGGSLTGRTLFHGVTAIFTSRNDYQISVKLCTCEVPPMPRGTLPSNCG